MSNHYNIACQLAGIAKRTGHTIDFVKMNILLYLAQGHCLALTEKPVIYGDCVVKAIENSDKTYQEIIGRETFERIVPIVEITKEEINEFMQTRYDENELKQYAIKIGLKNEDYDELISISDISEFVKKCFEKGYSDDIIQEIHFQSKLKNNIHDDSNWIFDTPEHPFEKYLEDKFKNKQSD